MSNYKYDSIVSKTEVEALKDMIFKRARERAEALNKTVQENYTSSVQKDVMDIARESFVASKNPFSLSETKTEKTDNKTVNSSEGIGFTPRKIDDIKAKISSKNNQVKEFIERKEVEEMMAGARNELSEPKKSFSGALGFLNTQASISALSGIKKSSFETIA